MFQASTWFDFATEIANLLHIPVETAENRNSNTVSLSDISHPTSLEAYNTTDSLTTLDLLNSISVSASAHASSALFLSSYPYYLITEPPKNTYSFPEIGKYSLCSTLTVPFIEPAISLAVLQKFSAFSWIQPGYVFFIPTHCNIVKSKSETCYSYVDFKFAKPEITNLKKLAVPTQAPLTNIHYVTSMESFQSHTAGSPGLHSKEVIERSSTPTLNIPAMQVVQKVSTTDSDFSNVDTTKSSNTVSGYMPITEENDAINKEIIYNNEDSLSHTIRTQPMHTITEALTQTPSQDASSITQMAIPPTFFRESCDYCAASNFIPGIITASIDFVAFEPDKDFAALKNLCYRHYRVYIDLRDIMSINILPNPLITDTIGSFPEYEDRRCLYLNVRCLDGRKKPFLTGLYPNIEHNLKAGLFKSNEITFFTTAFLFNNNAIGNSFFLRLLPLLKLRKPLRKPIKTFTYIPFTSDYYESKNDLFTMPDGAAHFFTRYHVDQIRLHLPQLYSIKKWKLIFCTKLNGVSYYTFHKNVSDKGPCVLILQDSNQVIFGSFTMNLKLDHRYYGTGETFVFTFKNDNMNLTNYPPIHVYHWTTHNNFFLFTDNQTIGIGGGGHYALTIDRDFLRGSSAFCTTFNSPCLASTEDFVIKHLQVWSLEF